MKQYITTATTWVDRGGPDPNDFETFNDWLREIADEVDKGKMAVQTLKDLQEAFGEALSVNTLQGISLRKPRGYAGDFEIIDRVYQRSLTTDPDLIKWDNFFLNTDAARAVRNRKEYFIALINNRLAESAAPDFTVLNIASGPARDVFEILTQHKEGPHANVRLTFDCVEYDDAAILYAETLCYQLLADIQFTKANAFRYTTKKRYPLVWSAGLFDYLDDRRFKFLLLRLYEFVAPGGELVIGNFSNYNPSRPYMEVMMDWKLHHRGPEALTHLAQDCGIPNDCIHIGQEPEGINLFLHLRRDPDPPLGYRSG